MNGKKLLLAIVPLVAVASIAGAGYSTFYFVNDQNSKTQADVSVTVDDFINVSSVEFTTEPTLTFTQSKQKTPEGFEQTYESDSGIIMNNWSVTFTFESSTGTGGAAQIGIDSFKLKYWWEINGDAKSYISSSLNEESPAVLEGTPSANTYSFTAATGDATGLEYILEPTSPQLYDGMTKAVTAKTNIILHVELTGYNYSQN